MATWKENTLFFIRLIHHRHFQPSFLKLWDANALIFKWVIVRRLKSRISLFDRTFNACWLLWLTLNPVFKSVSWMTLIPFNVETCPQEYRTWHRNQFAAVLPSWALSHQTDSRWQMAHVSENAAWKLQHSRTFSSTLNPLKSPKFCSRNRREL